MRHRTSLKCLAATAIVGTLGCTAAPWLDGIRAPQRRAAAKLEQPPPAGPDRLVLHADFPLAPDHRMIVELKSERELISERLGVPPGAEPIHVYLFADEQAYRAHVAKQFPDFPRRRAIFVETDVELSVYAHWGPHVAEDLRHEAAHGYLHSSVPNVPIWLDEGLAEYFEVGRGKRGLNQPHVDYLRDQAATCGWRPDLKRLEHLTTAAEMTQRDYAEAWLWVHWMLEGAPPHADVLQSYLVDLRNDRPPVSMSDRLRAAAPDADSQLGAHLRALVIERAPQPATVPTPLVP